MFDYRLLKLLLEIMPLQNHPLSWKYRTQFRIYNVDTPLRLKHFFAQADHESNLKPRRESLNYSVKALITMFGRHRISIEDAEKYGRKQRQAANQRAIANTIYGGEWGRKNLGNIHHNDGWDFRGGGIFQITGRYNYEAVQRRTGIPFSEHPELIEQEANSIIAALDFWENRNLNRYADEDNVLAVSQIVNVGSRKGVPNGLKDRERKTRHYAKIFS